MSTITSLLPLLSLLLLFSPSSPLSLRYVGQFPLYSVAFLHIDRFNSSSPLSLLATSFGVLSGDGLYYIPSPSLSTINDTKPIRLSSAITWPNEPEFVPSGTIRGYKSLVVVGGGFLVPTKDTGALTVINLDEGYAAKEISEYLSGWFYHRVRWADVDGDGLKDVITSRATKPIFGTGKGELVWYKQPASDPLGAGAPWKVHHVADGPDFLFEVTDVNNDGVLEVVAAEYFGELLTLTYSATGNWSDSGSIKQIVIDDAIKSGFDVRVLDINGDGKDDLVATNHMGDGTGSVFAYEVPENWQSGNWPRHVLASGFPVTESGLNQAAPGAPIPFFPQTLQKTGRAWIILAGDGSQCAYELRPNSATGWDYTLTTIVNTAATVGQPAVGDVNSDGYAEVFIPAYDSGIIYVYTYAP